MKNGCNRIEHGEVNILINVNNLILDFYYFKFENSLSQPHQFIIPGEKSPPSFLEEDEQHIHGVETLLNTWPSTGRLLLPSSSLQIKLERYVKLSRENPSIRIYNYIKRIMNTQVRCVPGTDCVELQDLDTSVIMI